MTYWSTLVASAFDRDEHRPQSRDAIRCAAVELRQRGLTVEDIGQALGLTSGAVRELLGETAPRTMLEKR